MCCAGTNYLERKGFALYSTWYHCAPQSIDVDVFRLGWTVPQREVTCMQPGSYIFTSCAAVMKHTEYLRHKSCTSTHGACVFALCMLQWKRSVNSAPEVDDAHFHRPLRGHAHMPAPSCTRPRAHHDWRPPPAQHSANCIEDSQAAASHQSSTCGHPCGYMKHAVWSMSCSTPSSRSLQSSL